MKITNFKVFFGAAVVISAAVVLFATKSNPDLEKFENTSTQESETRATNQISLKNDDKSGVKVDAGSNSAPAALATANPLAKSTTAQSGIDPEIKRKLLSSQKVFSK